MSAPAASPSVSVPPAGHSQAVAHALLGGMLLGLGAARRGPGGRMLRLAGAGMLARVLAPSAERLLVGAGSRRRSAEVDTTFTLEHPVREVFAFFSNLEHLLPVLPEVESIVDHADGRSDWRLRSPAGRDVRWRSIVTKYVPGEVIAWESVPGSIIRSDGIVRFAARGEARTHVTLRITFLPGAVEVSDALRALFSPAMQRRLRAGLARTPHHLSEWAIARAGGVSAGD